MVLDKISAIALRALTNALVLVGFRYTAEASQIALFRASNSTADATFVRADVHAVALNRLLVSATQFKDAESGDLTIALFVDRKSLDIMQDCLVNLVTLALLGIMVSYLLLTLYTLWAEKKKKVVLSVLTVFMVLLLDALLMPTLAPDAGALILDAIF